MPYIGNTVQNQGFAPAIDYFNGNGVTVTFTLSRPVASVAQLIVAIDNVIQNPSSAFTVAGNAITFTSAPLAGTNNIWVEYTSLITTYQGISQDPTVIGDIRATGGYLAEGDFGNSFIDGSLIDYVTGRGRFTVGELDDITFYHGGTSARSAMMDLYYAGGAKIYGTTALTIPVGTTAQRPGTPAVGMTRFNTTLGVVEYYNGSFWFSVTAVNNQQYSVEYLVIAGGGGSQREAGGGAGGYRSSVTGESSGGGASAESPINLISGTSYTVTIGAGGVTASNGSNSVFSTITSTGGGVGAQPGGNGGSGGGGGRSSSSARFAGSGTSGQGYNGGDGAANDGGGGGGGGGGGAGAIGNFGTGNTGGNGGNGVASSITGSSVTRAGGGGGGGSSSAGTAGTGGGGAGVTSGSGSAGTANTGGGAGGGNTTNSSGANGGSGIVIIRYSGAQRGTGGTVTSSGGFTIHTFTSSGTYTA